MTIEQVNGLRIKMAQMMADEQCDMGDCLSITILLLADFIMCVSGEDVSDARKMIIEAIMPKLSEAVSFRASQNQELMENGGVRVEIPIKKTSYDEENENAN